MALNLGKVFITAGCNKSWDVTIRNLAGQIVDVSAATDIEAVFVRDLTDGTRTPIFTKSLANQQVIFKTDGRDGVITILFSPANTQSYVQFTALDYGIKVYLPGSTIDEEDIGRGLAFIRISPVAIP